jgi:hypothetical protein
VDSVGYCTTRRFAVFTSVRLIVNIFSSLKELKFVSSVWSCVYVVCVGVYSFSAFERVHL